MVIFSNCKLNLGLHIVSKRDDGFHNLETIFYPIPLYDVIEIIVANTFTFTSTGLPINSSTENNLCVKAYYLLKMDFPNLPEVHIHLQKNIPMGAGIGGGSANAAYTLQLINTKFNLNINKEQLKKYAVQLGSDCAFFIENQTCYGTGRGEVLEPIEIDLSNYKIVLLFPGIHINTKTAFSEIIPTPTKIAITNIIEKPIADWKNLLHNDFEKSAFTNYPILEKYKSGLYELGASYASMSGSGSSLYGFFLPENIDHKKIELALKDITYKIL
jgi:4-diphosphocytidyl-2-C-methyl-D-erythritol kinase